MMDLGLDTYDKYEAWKARLESPEFKAELKRKFTHTGFSYKAMSGKQLRVVTRWNCGPECGACEHDREVRKTHPWYEG